MLVSAVGEFEYQEARSLQTAVLMKKSIPASARHSTVSELVYTQFCSMKKEYWVGFKWRPVLKVWEELQDKRSEEMQNSYR